MPAQGVFSARAYTSDAQIPVEGVTITVTQREPDGIVELLAVRLTDESGRIQPLTLPTPELALSLAPSPERPFALVRITADHPLYDRLVVEDVQLFPDTVTIQNLQLIPLNLAPSTWNHTEIFDIPPQNL